MKKRLVPAVTLLTGLIVGGAVSHYHAEIGLPWIPQAEAKIQPEASDIKAEPLYWVAPMDANYRRDKPGKSPMGMDLVPVYANAGASEVKGTVKISPVIENNLGVRTAQVSFDPLVSQVRTVGYLSPDEDSQWQLNSRVSGWVEKLHVKSTGETVQKGQPLIQLYSPDLVKAQDELVNALRLSNATLLVKSAKQRLQALGMNDDQIQTLVKTRQTQQHVTFYARQSGYLSQLNIREGAFISPATRLLEVVSLEQIWLKAELFESQAELVNKGDMAEITFDAMPGEQWQGKIEFIYPELDANSRTLVVRLRIPNEDLRLRPNMFARVQMQATADAPSLLIPREALIRSGTMDRVVLALGDGQYRSVRVQAGRENEQMIEVLEGLMPNQTVVTSAQFMLDSESSLTADFSRMEFGSPQGGMNHSGMDHSTMNHSTMDHSNMNHGGMDHSTMNHSTMDHSNMNHGGMDHSAMGSQTTLPLPAPTQKDDDLDWLDLDKEDSQ